MSRIVIIILFIIVGILETNAHDSKAAFFKINETDSAVIVSAEFPWTIRNALFTFEPELVNTKEKIKFDAAFFNYVKANFVIKDKNNKSLELISINEDKNEGHEHQTNYIFSFEKGDVFEISNSLMFNLTPKHKNHHTLTLHSKPLKFITSSNQTKFKIQQKQSGIKYWLIIPLILIAGIALTVRKRNIEKSK